MNAIEIRAKQRADEILRLEIAYSNLLRAYILGNRNEMIGAVGSALINNPDYAAALKDGINKVFSRQYGHNFFSNLNWCVISDEDIKLNVEGCLKAISETLSKNEFYSCNYTYAQSVLYKPDHLFHQEEILYQNEQGYHLRVADLLAISKYAVSIAETIAPSNEGYAKASAAIMVLQGFDAILNNKQEDKPVNKMLHLATNFISTVVKSSIKDDDAKCGITVSALMIDLAIDFFCKK